MSITEIQFKWDEPHHPESVCSAECEVGQAKQYVEGESCCWHCFNCTQYEVVRMKLLCLYETTSAIFIFSLYICTL